MDTDTLVENLLCDGARLIENLRQGGFEVTAAFWLRRSDDGKWRFCIVSPLVETAGLAQAYRQLHLTERKIPPPSSIDPLKIKVIGPSDPIAQDVVAGLSRTPRPSVHPIRWSGTSLGNVSIEGAYFYPLPAPTP